MSAPWFRALPAVVLLLAPGAADEELPHVDGKAILAHIKWLADDDREGRAAGSPGCLAAGDYIAAQLKQLGLKPMGDSGTYFQNFPLPRGFDIRPETSLTAERGTKKVTLSYDRHLKPLSLSGPGDVTAEAVFAGYGIAAPEVGYDDYAGVEVKGKVVIVLRHAPGFKDRKSPFSKPALMKRYATFQAKVNTAVGAGAAALVIVNDPKRTRKPKDDVPMHKVGGTPSAIPVFHVSYKAGRRLGKVCGFSFQKEQIRIDKEPAPRSRLLEGVTVHVNAALEAKTLEVRNVCALLEAPGPAATGQPSGAGKTKAAAPQVARETLVIGAHFDHVGLGSFGSRGGKKGPGSIHNGADDNASGSSSVLELATFFKARQKEL
ncbi:MAG: PA domain-containing protein, partial [Planctomycetota bacterium]